MLKKFVFLSFLFFACFPPLARAKDRVGNGGDLVALQFVFEARDCIRLLEAAGLTPVPASIVFDVKARLADIRVRSETGPLLLPGRTVDAINYADTGEIVLDRDRISALANGDRVAFAGIVLHEYLGAAGFDDSAYAISDSLIDVIRSKLKQGPNLRQRIYLDLKSIERLIERFQFVRNLTSSVVNQSDEQTRLNLDAVLRRTICFEAKDFSALEERIRFAFTLIDRKVEDNEELTLRSLSDLNAAIQNQCRSNAEAPEFETLLTPSLNYVREAEAALFH